MRGQPASQQASSPPRAQGGQASSYASRGPAPTAAAGQVRDMPPRDGSRDGPRDGGHFSSRDVRGGGGDDRPQGGNTRWADRGDDRPRDGGRGGGGFGSGFGGNRGGPQGGGGGNRFSRDDVRSSSSSGGHGGNRPTMERDERLEAELFGGERQNSGIEFKNYDDIPVEVRHQTTTQQQLALHFAPFLLLPLSAARLSSQQPN